MFSTVCARRWAKNRLRHVEISLDRGVGKVHRHGEEHTLLPRSRELLPPELRDALLLRAGVARKLDEAEGEIVCPELAPAGDHGLYAHGDKG